MLKRGHFFFIGLNITLVMALAGCANDNPSPTSVPISTRAAGYPVSATVLPTGYPSSLMATPQVAIPTPDVLAASPLLSGQVVFHSGSEGANNIFVLNLSSGEKHQLTTSGDNIEPVWSSDGTQIAYACKTEQFYALCLSNADGTTQRQIVSGDFNVWGPSWSSDGTQIAFVSNLEPYAHLYILDVVSGTYRRLLSSPGNEGTPRWLANSEIIVYMSDRVGFNIYAVQSDGFDERQMTTFGQDDRPAWSLDGRLITFRRDVVSASTFSGAEIMLMDSDGQNVRQLTSNSAADDWPSFSPNGEWIIYSTLRNAVPFLQVIPAKGGIPAPLFQGGVIGNAPHWKP